MSAYCVGCGRPLPCPKNKHNQEEQERLDRAARELNRTYFERQAGGRP